MNIIILDFETYYDAEYTLKKLSTSEYIRDHRYETIGCAVYSPMRALEALGGKDRAFLRHHEFKNFCERTDWSQTCVLAHHAHFDGLILSYHYGCRPLFWLDSLSMARAVVGVSVGGKLEDLLNHYKVGKKGDEVKKVGGKHAKDFTDEEFARYAEYSVNDAVGAWNVFCMLMEEYPWGFPQSELRLIDMTVRMFTEPTLMLNEPLMLAYMDQEAKRKLALLDRAIQGVYGGEDKQVMLALAGQEVSSATMKAQLMSNDKFAELLKSVGVDPPQKWSEKKQRMDWAFAKSDPGFQALKDHPSELVQILAEARLSTKSTINETRSRRIYNAGKFGQTLPVYLTYAGAHTFRWSGGDKTNYQNLERTSKDDPSKGAIRKAIVAPPGYKLVVADSAQIEARVLAWLAEQIDLVEAFAGGRDVYSEFASSIYGRKVDRKANKADFIPGFVGKVCIAEGEMVLTDNGIKPIETVLASDKVWDGLEWVSHDGVVYNGVREVITYSGLTATPDHEVYTEEVGKVSFWRAAHNGWRVIKPEADREEVRITCSNGGSKETSRRDKSPMPMYEMRSDEMENFERFANKTEKADRTASWLRHVLEQTWKAARTGWGCIRERGNHITKSLRRYGTLSVSGLWGRQTDKLYESQTRCDKGLSVLLADYLSSFVCAWEAVRCYGSAVPQWAFEVWGPWYQKQVSVQGALHYLGQYKSSAPGLHRCGDRPNRQRRSLRARELETSIKVRERGQPKRNEAHDVSGETDIVHLRSTRYPVSRTEVGLRHVIHTRLAISGYDGRKSDISYEEFDKSAFGARYQKVFDIVNAGPRHRFTVSGCLVSNCVLGLGYGMGFAKLAQQLAVGMLGGPPVVFTKDDANNMGVNVNAFASYEPFAKRVEEMASRIPLAERMVHSAVCHQVVQRYRDRNKSVVQFWRGCEDIIDLMVKTPYGKAHPIGPMEIVRQGLKLPSGMLMKYPNLRNRKDDADVKLMEAIAGEDAYQGRPEWVYQSREGHTRLYGGLLTENIVQALSRVIISDQMLAARDAGHRIVTMTHDEIVTLAPEAEAEQRYKELIQIMRTTPSWARGLPLNAEGGYGDAYGDIK